MNRELEEIKSMLRSALRKLVNMEEYGSSAEDFNAQRSRCRALRAQLNAICPDGEYDPNENNIVERV